jgi:hypothetical protein
MRSFFHSLIAAALTAGFTAHAWAAERDYQRADAGSDYKVTASFVNFNRDPLSIAFVLPKRAVRESMDEFGYATADMDRMAQTCGCTQEEHDKNLENYYRSRGVGWRTSDAGWRLFVDVPEVVKRNRSRLKALAGEFDKLATARGYGPDDTLGAMLTFVQSALPYKRPPNEEGERDILGFYPPPRALEAGFGDCDTKSALLASILASFPGTRMIGVHVPKHYLVGIARVPRPGDAFIEYEGEPFVLVEPSGPARLPPGMIGPTTQAALATMAEVRIDPLF